MKKKDAEPARKAPEQSELIETISKIANADGGGGHHGYQHHEEEEHGWGHTVMIVFFFGWLFLVYKSKMFSFNSGRRHQTVVQSGSMANPVESGYLESLNNPSNGSGAYYSPPDVESTYKIL